MVVAQFTGLAREAQVRDGWDSDVGLGCGEGEPVGPAVLRLVLQVESQRLVLEVRQAGLGGDRSASQTTGLILLAHLCVTRVLMTYGTTSQFIGLAVMRLVVASLSVAHHSHHVRERGAGTVVLVGVEEDTETLEVIR